MNQCSNACDDDAKDGDMYAVRFQLPAIANSTKGAPVETFTTQFTRHCRVKELMAVGDEIIGPASKGVVRYQIKHRRDPQLATVTGKWQVYLPQLGITLNLVAQGANSPGRKLRFVGVHVV